MRIILLMAALILSNQLYAKASRDGGEYQGKHDGNSCYFDIWPDFRNLKFQIEGDIVTLGTQGVPISPDKVRFEGTVWYDYAESKYVPMKPDYAGAQYTFTLILEFGPQGRTLNAVMTRDKVSGYIPSRTKTATCEGIELVRTYFAAAEPITCSSSVN